MFANAKAFTSDLSNWNVENVTTMANMFYGASSFNGSLK
jgi:surface protein